MPKSNAVRVARLIAAVITAIVASGFGLVATSTAASAVDVPKFKPASSVILFSAGSSRLSAAASQQLSVIAGSFEPASAISITGYVRGVKQSPGALQKSLTRAQAVAAALSARGITATISVSGLGASSKYQNSKYADRVEIVTTSAPGLLWAEEFNSPSTAPFDHSIWTALLDHGFDQLGFWNYGTGEIESNTEAAAVRGKQPSPHGQQCLGRLDQRATLDPRKTQLQVRRARHSRKNAGWQLQLAGDLVTGLKLFGA